MTWENICRIKVEFAYSWGSRKGQWAQNSSHSLPFAQSNSNTLSGTHHDECDRKTGPRWYHGSVGLSDRSSLTNGQGYDQSRDELVFADCFTWSRSISPDPGGICAKIHAFWPAFSAEWSSSMRKVRIPFGSGCKSSLSYTQKLMKERVKKGSRLKIREDKLVLVPIKRVHRDESGTEYQWIENCVSIS